MIADLAPQHKNPRSLHKSRQIPRDDNELFKFKPSQTLSGLLLRFQDSRCSPSAADGLGRINWDPSKETILAVALVTPKEMK
ncbi:hypothetical protein PGT21_019892 [Puccinia graminis f. sp. tritici]|uniref:Uncharacterized protein n=1 Tax=Puccinia graminis f. sp. tritici TaxID=56615 RepID=A0A5B0NYN7_PUCGR|nr:hypothetical protein PGT21_019892 [Puccinia graminis f. sp. tritici]